MNADPSTGDKIRLSYWEHAPHISIEIGRSDETPFNIFRVDQKLKGAILTTAIIKDLMREAKGIASDISSPILDDSILCLKLKGRKEDSLDLSSRVRSKIMDVASIMLEQILLNTERNNLWKFFHYSVLRVEYLVNDGQVNITSSNIESKI